jgi:hypothetical protein
LIFGFTSSAICSLLEWARMVCCGFGWVSREERVVTTLKLGPMSAAVRATVGQLVEAAREKWSSTSERFLGYLLWGGPGGCDFLDANGEVWAWSALDDAVEHVPDGPRKVGAIAIAAQRVPALAAWLPSRPNDAVVCQLCRGQGWLDILQPSLLCPKCRSMGWNPRKTHGSAAAPNTGRSP